MSNPIPWIVNLSLLFSEHPLLERPAAAAAAGFDAVEVWWPFGDNGRPDAAEVDAFVEAVAGAGVQLYAMNLFAGDMPAGERGVMSYSERAEEFRDSVAVAAEVAERLGTRFFNLPYGHRRPGLDPAVQDAMADQSIAHAAATLARFDGTVLFEPLSGMPDYPLKTLADGWALIARLKTQGVGNVGLLVDQYHSMMNGEDVPALVRDNPGEVAHVQIADVPNRGEPGSGESLAAIHDLVRALEETDYPGTLALEYFPTVPTERSLEVWRAHFVY